MEFFNYEDKINNFYGQKQSSPKKQNNNFNYKNKMNPMHKNVNNNSQRLKNEKNNNQQLYNLPKNNFLKSERNINKNYINTNNININQIQNQLGYQIKLENIKTRVKDLLDTYNFLLRNKIVFGINENNNNQ